MNFPTSKLNQEQERSRSRNCSRKEAERQPSSIREEGQRIGLLPMDHGSEARLQPLGRTDKGKQKGEADPNTSGRLSTGQVPMRGARFPREHGSQW